MAAPVLSSDDVAANDAYLAALSTTHLAIFSPGVTDFRGALPLPWSADLPRTESQITLLRKLSLEPELALDAIFHVMQRPLTPTLSECSAGEVLALRELATWLQLPESVCARLQLETDACSLRTISPGNASAATVVLAMTAPLRDLWDVAIRELLLLKKVVGVEGADVIAAFHTGLLGGSVADAAAAAAEAPTAQWQVLGRLAGGHGLLPADGPKAQAAGLSSAVCAAAGGDVAALRWLRGQDPPCAWGADVCRFAAENGRLAALQWLRAEASPPCPWDRWTCAGAAAGGHVGILRWARAQDPPCPWGDCACSAAVDGGKLEALRWLRGQEPPCPWYPRWILLVAERLGYTDIAQWARENGCVDDDDELVGECGDASG